MFIEMVSEQARRRVVQAPLKSDLSLVSDDEHCLFASDDELFAVTIAVMVRDDLHGLLAQVASPVGLNPRNGRVFLRLRFLLCVNVVLGDCL